MLRSLLILAGVSCALFILSVTANVVAVRQPTSVEPPAVEKPAPLEPRLVVRDTPAPLPDPDPARAAITRQADEMARGMLEEAIGASLTERVSEQPVSSSRFVLASPDRALWVTRTEVRVPCRDLDAALSDLNDAKLGRPRHCERWVEATAAVLERHGVDMPARQFLEAYGGDRDVRVLLVYAGWTAPPDAPSDAHAQLVHAHSAPVYPHKGFPAAKRAALDAVYRELELGPYADPEG